MMWTSGDPTTDDEDPEEHSLDDERSEEDGAIEPDVASVPGEGEKGGEGDDKITRGRFKRRDVRGMNENRGELEEGEDDVARALPANGKDSHKRNKNNGGHIQKLDAIGFQDDLLDAEGNDFPRRPDDRTPMLINSDEGARFADDEANVGSKEEKSSTGESGSKDAGREEAFAMFSALMEVFPEESGR